MTTARIMFLLATALIAGCSTSPASTRAIALKGNVTAYEIVTRSTFLGASGRQQAFKNPIEQRNERDIRFFIEADTICPNGHDLIDEDLARVTNTSISVLLIDIRHITCL